MKWLFVLAVIWSFIESPFELVRVEPVSSLSVSEVQPPSPSGEVDNAIETKAFRSGRRTYRAPRSGYTGNPSGTNRTGRETGGNAPAARPPASRGGGFGGFWGGIVAGSLLGSLFNPFGYGGFGYGGINWLAVLIWGGLLYAAFRFIRRMLAVRR